MKRIVETVEGDGLEKLIGEDVQVWCMNYIYAGKLIGVNSDDICLGNPSIVYETGVMETPGFGNVQRMGIDEGFVRTSSIEFYGKVNNA